MISGEVTELIIGGAIEVHRALGPGLLESAYEACLARELSMRNLSVRRQVPLPVFYKGEEVECGYRIDMMINDQVIVELKCVDEIAPVHTAQLLTYLRLSSKRVGLLINFHASVLKDAIVRRAL
ncbi:MAG TPA: GxxExxY protein [Phycisphaerales bacterium]|nr:GxxExxY protein [Phycisphaerales bacterium]